MGMMSMGGTVTKESPLLGLYVGEIFLRLAPSFFIIPISFWVMVPKFVFGKIFGGATQLSNLLNTMVAAIISHDGNGISWNLNFIRKSFSILDLQSWINSVREILMNGR